MSSTAPFATVDVFTQKRFKGNQLAVVDITAPGPLSVQSMQTIAREFGFSETVFLDRTNARNPRIRIFTPASEIQLAGHPIIGTGHVLFRHFIQHDQSAGAESVTDVTVETNVGIVGLHYDPEQQVVAAHIPHNVHIHSKLASKQDLLVTQPSLPSTAIDAMQTGYPLVSIVKGVSYVLVDCSENASLFKSVSAGPGPESKLDEDWAPSHIGAMYYKVLDHSVKDGKNFWKLQARMIAIGLEDPATGSACCSLAAYLALTVGGKDSGHYFDITQGVEIGRDSNILVDVSLRNDGRTVSTLLLSGHATPVTQGTMFLTDE